MDKIYKSNAGEVRSYPEWELEANKFYDSLYDYDFPVYKPANWFERWEKVLGLTEVSL